MKLFWVVCGLWVISEIAALAFYIWLFSQWSNGPAKD